MGVMQPGIRLGQPPPFQDLDEYTFQDLCRDILDHEPEVATCDIYGKRGQRQLGIDLFAPRKGGSGLDVGQCKCYRTFGPKQIEAASDEFLDHWDRWWSKRNVKRFVLFVSCDLESRGCADKILEERDRFAQYGVEYEAWSSAKIR